VRFFFFEFVYSFDTNAIAVLVVLLNRVAPVNLVRLSLIDIDVSATCERRDIAVGLVADLLLARHLLRLRPTLLEV